MSIKVILSLLQGTDSDARVLGCVEFLAKNCLAHVSVLHMRPDPRTHVPYVGDEMSEPSSNRSSLVLNVMETNAPPRRGRASKRGGLTQTYPLR